MWGKAYDFHRHSGRMIMDNNQRMSNRAEVGMAFPALIILSIMFLVFFSLFS